MPKAKTLPVYSPAWDITDIALDLTTRLIERTGGDGPGGDPRLTRRLLRRMHRATARYLEERGLGDFDQIVFALQHEQAKKKKV